MKYGDFSVLPSLMTNQCSFALFWQKVTTLTGFVLIKSFLFIILNRCINHQCSANISVLQCEKFITRKSLNFHVYKSLQTIVNNAVLWILSSYTEYLQWNESSQDTSGGSSYGHKMNFSKIMAMVGIFLWFRGLPKTFIFFLASKVGDEKTVKWP